MSDEIRDVIEVHPKPVGILPVEKASLLKEFRIILDPIKQQYMTAKDIHMLYFDDKKRAFSKSQKTIYRYIHKLVDEGILIEVGHRESPHSRVNETLYGQFAQVIFFDDPDEIERWRSEVGQGFIEVMHTLVEKKLGTSLDYPKFQEYTLSFLDNRDKISTELAEYLEDPEVLASIQSIPTDRLSQVLIVSTYLSMMIDEKNRWD